MEQPSSTNRVDRLIYPPLPPNPPVVPRSSTNESPLTSPTDSTNSTLISSPPSPEQSPNPSSLSPVPKLRFSPKNPLAKPTFIFSQQPNAGSSDKPLSLVTLRSPTHNPALAPQLPPCVNLPVNANGGSKDNQNLNTAANNSNQQSRPSALPRTFPASADTPVVGSCLQPGPDILPLLKVTFSPTSDSVPSSKSSVVSAEVRQRIKELLSMYSQGLWAHALPKLFMDTYKTPFPEHILENLTLYLDIWTVEYPVSHDKKKVSE